MAGRWPEYCNIRSSDPHEFKLVAIRNSVGERPPKDCHRQHE